MTNGLRFKTAKQFYFNIPESIADWWETSGINKSGNRFLEKWMSAFNPVFIVGGGFCFSILGMWLGQYHKNFHVLMAIVPGYMVITFFGLVFLLIAGTLIKNILLMVWMIGCGIFRLIGLFIK